MSMASKYSDLPFFRNKLKMSCLHYTGIGIRGNSRSIKIILNLVSKPPMTNTK